MAPEAPADEVDDRKKDRGVEDDGRRGRQRRQPDWRGRPGGQGPLHVPGRPRLVPGERVGGHQGQGRAGQLRRQFYWNAIVDVRDAVPEALPGRHRPRRHRRRRKAVPHLPSTAPADAPAEFPAVGPACRRSSAPRASRSTAPSPSAARTRAAPSRSSAAGRRTGSRYAGRPAYSPRWPACFATWSARGRDARPTRSPGPQTTRRGVRAVSVLLNLSAERKNRMLIANHPGMLESVGHVREARRRRGAAGGAARPCCT